MSQNLVADYGWDASGPESCSYLAPEVLAILARLGARRVLDLGAGNGALCAEMAAAGLDPVGVEYDAHGVEVAQQKYPSLRFHRLGVQDDPAPLVNAEGTFDAVVSTEVVEHLFSPHLLPRFAHACLAQGGHLIVSTPYHGYVKNLMLSVFDKWDHHHTALWHGGHIKFWSRKTLAELLSSNGFRVVGFSGVGRLPFLWKSMIMVVQKVDGVASTVP